MSERVQIVLTDDQAEWLTGRSERAAGGSVALQAKAEIQAWRDHLAAELVRIQLTLPELGCVAHVLNGTAILNAGAGLIASHELVDAFSIADSRDLDGPGSYGRHYGIDEGALLIKVGRLGPTGQHALADAVARWWQDGGDHTPEGWAAVGIVPTSRRYAGCWPSQSSMISRMATERAAENAEGPPPSR